MLLESSGVALDAAPAQKSSGSTFADLPTVARVYVAVVIAAGVTCLVSASFRLRLDDVVLFIVLAAAGVAMSAAKIELPLGRSQSNLSLSHAVNFWALFALGSAPTVCIAAVSAWAQCTFRRGPR